MSYTPGPWIQELRDDGNHVRGGNDELLATTYPMDQGQYHAARANAKLIAAAPDLLAMLKHVEQAVVHRSTRQPDIDIAKVRAAIAKAEGR